MPSDIAERLRELAQYAYDYEDGTVLDAAAAEIEQLREGAKMIQQTIAEELHFIHQHIEQIEVRVDAINEELRALHTVMRQLLKTFDRMTDVIEQANGG